MKIPLLLLIFSASWVCAAEPAPDTSQTPASVEERRAAALSKRMERFETMKGRIYEDVRITAIDAGGVSLSHSAGTARLRYDDLSPQQRRYFGLDEAAAAEVYRKERAARAAYEKRVEERKIARREAMEKAHEEERLAAEQAEKERAERALAAAGRELTASEKIPSQPTIQRVDTDWFRHRSSRRYSPYWNNYGYYGNYYGSGHYRSGYHRPPYNFRYHSRHHRGHGWGVRLGSSGSSFVIGW